MEKKIFNGEFKVLDYSISHRILLIRFSEIKDGECFNTDIAFVSTYYVELPTVLSNIEIYEGELSDYSYVLERCNIENEVGFRKVYVLISENSKYYIGAGNYQIQQNSLLPLETSLGLKR